MKNNANIPSSQRRHEIIALAESLSLSRFPRRQVEPEKIAVEEGIKVMYGSFPRNIDGLLLHDQGQYVMVGNERRAPRGSPRSRFTFAHELAHYFLRDHRQALHSGLPAARTPHPGTRGELHEYEADLFAANLLMPEPAFREMAFSLSLPGLELVVNLADLFGTSLTATAYRALELNLFPAPSAIFLWDALGDAAGRRISPQTLTCGEDYAVLAAEVPSHSVTAEAVQNLRYGQQQGTLALMDWFTGLSGQEPAHQRLVREEVISLGFHGWMTLVHRREE